MGSHIFTKNSTVKKNLQINVVDAIDPNNEMEFDSFNFVLNDGLQNYYTLDDQSTEATINYNKLEQVPRIGENILTASG